VATSWAELVAGSLDGSKACAALAACAPGLEQVRRRLAAPRGGPAPRALPPSRRRAAQVVAMWALADEAGALRGRGAAAALARYHAGICAVLAWLVGAPALPPPSPSPMPPEQAGNADRRLELLAACQVRARPFRHSSPRAERAADRGPARRSTWRACRCCSTACAATARRRAPRTWRASAARPRATCWPRPWSRGCLGAAVRARRAARRCAYADLSTCETCLGIVSSAVQAHSDTLEAGARRLDAEAERRVLALLVERVIPLLLRCLRLWRRSASRSPRCSPGAARACWGPPCAWPAQLRAAPRAAGPRRVPDALACVSASALGDLLSSKELCQRVPGEERVAGLRCLYAVLHWTSQRLDGLARLHPLGTAEQRGATLQSEAVSRVGRRPACPAGRRAGAG